MPIIRRTGEHRQLWGTVNIENQDFVFGEQSHFFEGNKGTGTPLPWEGLTEEALENEDRIDELKKKYIYKKKKKKKQPTCPVPAANIAGPCPTICQSSRTLRHWKLPSTIARPKCN